MRKTIWFIVAFVTLMVSPLSGGAAGGNLQYVDLDALKSMLHAKDLLIIDVRQPGDWNSSTKKIQGAVRKEPDQVATWGPNLPKDKRIVLYCA